MTTIGQTGRRDDATTMRRASARALPPAGLALIAAMALSGCESLPFLGGGADGGESGVAPAASVELVERDVEAPEVFQVSAQGLWDGRPSLGGVWVAHPDVAEPERVIIRNPGNGQFVIGALFRRERDNPGPALQVSSDAAQALGLLAGAPGELNVTALRREEAANPAPTAETDPAAALAGEEIATASLDVIPGAAAAIDAAEAAGAGTVAAAAPAAAQPAAAPPAAATASASSLERPFIQLGIFSVEANARGLLQDMDARGLPTRIVEFSSQGRNSWRVLVGPAADAAQRTAYLEQVKAQGFNDAYFVRN